MPTFDLYSCPNTTESGIPAKGVLLETVEGTYRQAQAVAETYQTADPQDPGRYLGPVRIIVTEGEAEASTPPKRRPAPREEKQDS